MPTTDRFSQFTPDLSAPADRSFDIVPSLTDFNVATRAIYVGVTGNVVAKLLNDSNVYRTFASVPVGLFPIRAIGVSNASTANAMVGLY